MFGAIAASRRRTPPGPPPPLIANGDFASGTSPWAPAGATLTNSAGRLRLTSDANFGYCTASVALTIGRAYRLTLDCDPGTSASVGVKLGSGALSTNTANATITSVQTGYAVDFTANFATTVITLQSLAGVPGRWFEIDNISLTPAA